MREGRAEDDDASGLLEQIGPSRTLPHGPMFGQFDLYMDMHTASTTRNIHFYDENLNDESKTSIEDRFL
jgi:hypothetical protein